MVAVSQSGKTADTLAVFRHFSAKGSLRLASSEANGSLPTGDGQVLLAEKKKRINARNC